MTNALPFALTARTPGDPEADFTSLVVIYRAMRQDLARLAALLGQIAARQMALARERAVCRYTAALLAEISAHHDNEDGILWPLIAATAGQCVDLTPLTDDHQVIEGAVRQARRALAAFAASPPAAAAGLHVSVSELRNMLGDHIADEQDHIFPAMRHYLPAPAYQWYEQQVWRNTSSASLRFRVPWLARFSEPGELDRMLATSGWRTRLLLTAGRPAYTRLERQAFGTWHPPGSAVR